MKNIEFISSVDNDMKIRLFQWDLNVQAKISTTEHIEEVHFAQTGDENALVVETKEKDGYFVVDVPNILLQKSENITIYVVENGNTIFSETFSVAKREKPADYVYTETEVKTYESLEERIKTLEESSGGSSGSAGGGSYIAELTWDGDYAVIDGHKLSVTNGLIDGESVCWLSDDDFRTLVDILKRKILVSEIFLMEMWYITYLDYDNDGEIGAISLSSSSGMDAWIFYSRSFYTASGGW